jgi:type I restriction-modification system DNA methylase subunit
MNRFDRVFWRRLWKLAKPPFGGKERKEVQENFPIRTGETAFLFLQHFIRILKAGGRGGVVIKNPFLSNSDDLSVKNPNGGEEITHRSPEEIMDEIAALDAESFNHA